MLAAETGRTDIVQTGMQVEQARMCYEVFRLLGLIPSPKDGVDLDRDEL